MRQRSKRDDQRELDGDEQKGAVHSTPAARATQTPTKISAIARSLARQDERLGWDARCGQALP